MKHVIISRVNIPRELDPTKYKDPAPYKRAEWNEQRVELLNKYTRASLRMQTCQNFKFITLWNGHDPRHADSPGRLENEIHGFIRRGRDGYLYDDRPFNFEAWQQGTNDKKEMDFAYQIRDWARMVLPSVFHHRDDEPWLFTNLDSDDCLHYQAVERLQARAREVVDKAPYYLDVENRFVMNIHRGGMGHKQRKTPSPMVSTVENEIECYPLRWHHSMMGEHLEGEVVRGVHGLQTVNDTNIFTRGTGKSAEFKPSLFY